MHNKNDLDKVIVCRCEDITLGEIRELINKGYTTIDEIKRVSRCGFGPCQGKTCMQLLLTELTQQKGKDIKEIKMPTHRPPTRNIELGVLARGEEDEK